MMKMKALRRRHRKHRRLRFPISFFLPKCQFSCLKQYADSESDCDVQRDSLLDNARHNQMWDDSFDSGGGDNTSPDHQAVNPQGAPHISTVSVQCETTDWRNTQYGDSNSSTSSVRAESTDRDSGGIPVNNPPCNNSEVAAADLAPDSSNLLNNIVFGFERQIRISPNANTEWQRRVAATRWQSEWQRRVTAGSSGQPGVAVAGSSVSTNNASPANMSNRLPNDGSSASAAHGSGSSGASRRVNLQQNWYIYDPRLVPESRANRQTEVTHYRGVQNVMSMPGIIGPPPYEENPGALEQSKGDATPLDPPPPYTELEPPPLYDGSFYPARQFEADFQVMDLGSNHQGETSDTGGSPTTSMEHSPTSGERVCTEVVSESETTSVHIHSPATTLSSSQASLGTVGVGPTQQDNPPASISASLPSATRSIYLQTALGSLSDAFDSYTSPYNQHREETQLPQEPPHNPFQHLYENPFQPLSPTASSPFQNIHAMSTHQNTNQHASVVHSDRHSVPTGAMDHLWPTLTSRASATLETISSFPSDLPDFSTLGSLPDELFMPHNIPPDPPAIRPLNLVSPDEDPMGFNVSNRPVVRWTGGLGVNRWTSQNWMI